MSKTLPGLRALCVSMALWFVTGCDDGDPDRTPPVGQGSIFVNNQTSSDLQIYIDGIRFETVQDYEDKYYDLAPGLYRIIIDEQDGDRTYRDDVDVIEGRITVIDVAMESFGDDFDVEVFFRTP